MREFQEDAGIPDALFDESVREIIVDEYMFTWRLSPGAGIPEVIPLNIEGIKKKDTKTERTAS